MKKLYVIGNKSSKSLSPTIFNYWFKKYKIDAQYDFLEIKNNFKREIYEILKIKNLLGLNITIPYKKEILSFLDSHDNHSKKIGAVNCVVLKNKKIKGLNTDWLGYKKLLTKHKINNKNKVIILGYGGAAMAIYYSLTQCGFEEILVFNRTKRAIRNINKKKYTKNIKGLQKHLADTSLIINTTPTNLLKKNQHQNIKKTAIISDIVYSPKNTTFLNQFKKNKKIYGISMLLYQAAPCFREWFGFEPSIDKGLLKELENKIS